jgi:hypothetical protein
MKKIFLNLNMYRLLLLIALLTAATQAEVTVTAIPLNPGPVKKHFRSIEIIKTIDARIPDFNEATVSRTKAINDPTLDKALISLKTRKIKGKLAQKKKVSPGRYR